MLQLFLFLRGFVARLIGVLVNVDGVLAEFPDFDGHVLVTEDQVLVQLFRFLGRARRLEWLLM